MDPSFNVLLASDPCLIRSVFLEILRTHGHHVVMEGCGMTSLVIGHSFPGPIHLMVADLDYGGQGKGPWLAENLSYLRPQMQSLFFTVSSGTLWLIGGSPSPDDARIPFTPGAFLELVTGALFERPFANT
jgi:hypothetical protein